MECNGVCWGLVHRAYPSTCDNIEWSDYTSYEKGVCLYAGLQFVGQSDKGGADKRESLSDWSVDAQSLSGTLEACDAMRLVLVVAQLT